MAITDLITLLLSVFLLMRGSSRGFLNSLLGPLCLILASVISILYYQATKDIVISLIIGLIGPLLLVFILKFFIRTLSGDIETSSTLLSRLGGALLTLIWGWVFIVLTLFVLTLLPPLGKVTIAMHDDIVRSKSYLLVKPVEKLIFAAQPSNTTANKKASVTADAQSLAHDQRFQKVMQDPEIQKAVEERNFAKLMSHPKIMELTQQIMNDPEALKKVLAVYKNQSQLLDDNQPSSK